MSGQGAALGEFLSQYSIDTNTNVQIIQNSTEIHVGKWSGPSKPSAKYPFLRLKDGDFLYHLPLDNAVYAAVRSHDGQTADEIVVYY